MGGSLPWLARLLWLHSTIWRGVCAQGWGSKAGKDKVQDPWGVLLIPVTTTVDFPPGAIRPDDLAYLSYHQSTFRREPSAQTTS